jgi:predicted nucleotidyltransferase
MNALENKILNELKTSLLKKVPLHALILFGSRARGDADPDSDMDILVIVDSITEKIRDQISDSAWEIGYERGIVIIPVVFSRDEWENSPHRLSLLATTVKSEGIPI